jgi:hypothetical protein
MSDLETRLRAAGDHWRGRQPAGPRPDPSTFVTVRPLKRKRDLLVPLAAAVAVVAVTAGILTSRHYTSSPPATTPTVQVVRNGDTVGASGKVVVNSAGTGEFCQDFSDSKDNTDPTCGNPKFAVSNVKVSALANANSVNGLTVGFGYLQGTWSDGNIAVTRQGPPQSTSAEETPSAPLPTTPDTVPCPAPAGGWQSATSGKEPGLSALASYVKQHPNTVSGYGSLYPAVDGKVDPNVRVFIVGVVGDVAAAQRAISTVNPGNLCVVKADHSYADVTHADSMAKSKIGQLGIRSVGMQTENLASYTWYVNIDVAVVDEPLWNFIQGVGPGLVRLNPWIQKQPTDNDLTGRLHDGDTVGGSGRVVIAADGKAEFCPDLSPAPSVSPTKAQVTCGKRAVAVSPIDPNQLANRQVDHGLVSGDAYLQGVWQDGAIEVQRQLLPRALSGPQIFDSVATPCPAPADGWASGYNFAPDSLTQYVESHPDEFSGLWYTTPDWKDGHPVYVANSSGALRLDINVSTIGVTGDRAAALKQLQSRYSSKNNVCVVQTRNSASELERAMKALNSADVDDASIVSVQAPHLDRTGDDQYVARVSLVVTTYTEQVRQLVDQVGSDLIDVQPWLTKIN